MGRPPSVGVLDEPVGRPPSVGVERRPPRSPRRDADQQALGSRLPPGPPPVRCWAAPRP